MVKNHNLPVTGRLLGYLILLFFSLTVHAQKEISETVIFWDSSLSRIERDSKAEIEYLEAYFQRFKNSEVLLIGFSNTVYLEENHRITNGDWSGLRNKIETLQYDGATSFLGLEQYSSEGYNLIFTDGSQNLRTSTPKFKGKTAIINSSKNYDRRSINLLSIIGKADFLNLVEKQEEKEQQTALQGPKSGQKKDSSRLDLGQGVQLEEVIVSERSIELENKAITPLGEKDKDAIGYAVQSIGSERISDAVTTLNTGLQGKFSGVTLGQNDDLSQVVLRPSNSLIGNNYGLIVIDGIPLPQSQSIDNGIVYNTNFIDPKNIADITVLKGLAATNIYGTQGVNGVLLITTKTGTYGKTKDGTSDAMQLKDNYYDAKIKIDKKTLVTPYLKELKNGKNVQSAYQIYMDQRQGFKDSQVYLLDIFDFFYASSPTIAFRILSNVLENESPDYELLRGAYLKSMEKKNPQLALAIVEKLKVYHSEKAQNRYDYALTQRDLGNYQIALDMLNNLIKDNINIDSNMQGFEKPVGAEMRNLINQHKNTVDVSGVDSKYQNNITYNARLILEWNNPEAEFVVQFVNPQKRFFDWEHTVLSDRKRFQQGLEAGYYTEQFEIVGSDTVGEWILNITSQGNYSESDENVTFVKCTVVKNFGKSNQENESFMVRLQEPNDKKELAKFLVE